MGSPSVVRRHDPMRGGSFAVESVAGLLWNQWQLSYGTGGSFAVESVAGFTWNRWQLCGSWPIYVNAEEVSQFEWISEPTLTR